MYKNAVVITGNIASGKSSVCEILKNQGYKVIDADIISHEILAKNSTKIATIFGNSILDENGFVDRKKLGKIVFADKLELRKLENLLHPLIKDKIFANARKLEKLISSGEVKSPYFVDIPLYFESGDRYKEFKKVALVFTPFNLQIERLMKRDNISKEFALQKISHQISADEKLKKADFVIENGGNLADLEKNIDEFLKKI